MGPLTHLINFGAKQPLVPITGERWRELRALPIFNNDPSIDFLLDPGILQNLIRVQGQVLSLPNKAAQQLHPLEELFLPKACKLKRGVLRKLGIFIGKEAEAQELAKNLIVSIGEHLAPFQLTADLVNATRAAQAKPEHNPELFKTLSDCLIDPKSRADKTQKTRLHQPQQEALDKLSKTIEDGLKVVDQFFALKHYTSLELIAAIEIVGISLLELKGRLDLFKKSIAHVRAITRSKPPENQLP